MAPGSVILSTCEGLEACHLPNFPRRCFSVSLLPSLSLSLSFSLSILTRPNPEARRHRNMGATFDGSGLKQIYIPLVDFKRCLNNNGSQGQFNEACSGLAGWLLRSHLQTVSDEEWR